MSLKIRGKQPNTYVPYPQDYRLQDRNRITKLEPPSQIQKNQVFAIYNNDSLYTFMKPLIDKTQPLVDKQPYGRYSHNYGYVAHNPIQQFKPQPFNQSQKEYSTKTTSENISQPILTEQYINPQQNSMPNLQITPDNNRLSYSQIGNNVMQQYSGAQSSRQQQQPMYYGPRALKNLESSNLY